MLGSSSTNRWTPVSTALPARDTAPSIFPASARTHRSSSASAAPGSMVPCSAPTRRWAKTSPSSGTPSRSASISMASMTRLIARSSAHPKSSASSRKTTGRSISPPTAPPGPARPATAPNGEQMVGVSLARSIYIFVAETTEQQDRKLIAEFNSLPNVNHFNGVTRNCADFTRHVINTYFPHATSPDYINDFGITSPKAIARSFTHYALRHPETHFRVLHFAQVPGTIKRSSEPRDGTEQLYHSKKLLVPMIIFAEHELPVVAASYLLTGRFNPRARIGRIPDRRGHRDQPSDPARQGRPAERARHATRSARARATRRRRGHSQGMEALSSGLRRGC